MRFYNSDYQIYYEKTEQGIIIVDSDSKCTEITIPEIIDGEKIIGIGRKAFLGRKLLRSVNVDANVSTIGDWAFAYCDNLKQVIIQRNRIQFGQGVFKGDDSLEVIDARSYENNVSVGNLMAAAVITMQAEYMLEPTSAGTDEWLEMWDRKLADMLNTKDEDGYHLYVLCGEEDLHFDYEEYIEYVREKKSGLCLMRLINDVGLTDDFRNRLKNYILSMCAGCECDASWKYVLKNRGDSQEYYDCMIEIGAIGSDNLETALENMGQRHAEMKAYIIKRIRGGEEGEESSKDDFFAGLEL